MKGLRLAQPGERLSVLCLGAHSDDIEIGAGATLLEWIAHGVQLDVTWVVLSAIGQRAVEAHASATAFLAGSSHSRIELAEFKDGFFPYHGAELKTWFEALKATVSPDVILTHSRDDAHQDHREVSSLTWNTFRDHLILEYEIVKYEGDLGSPNVFMPLAADIVERKLAHLMRAFPSQHSQPWFDPAAFSAILRLRGVEASAPSGFAEGFTARKLVLA